MKFIFLIPLLLLIVLDMLGRFFVKKGFDDKKLYLLFVSFLMYFFLVIALFFTFYYKSFAKSCALWDAGTLIISILIGRYYFSEKFTYIDVIGFSCIVTGFFLLSFF